MDDRWNLQNIPPKGHDDTAEFAYKLFEVARQEKERLGKPQTMLHNYALYRGHQGRQQTGRKGYPQQQGSLTPINLYFANVERTVSVITARNPTGEVVDLDGLNDGTEEILSTQLKKWWKETDQLLKTRHTARTMEVYGITSEKPYWDKTTERPDIMVTDPFSFFPCPGYYDDLSLDCPYICYAYVDFVSKIEADFRVKGVAKDDAYGLLGTVREGYKSKTTVINQSIGNYSDPMTIRKEPESGQGIQKCLVIEVWLRDNRERRQETPIMVTDGADGFIPATDEAGNQIVEVKKVKVYPDGVRKITITKSTETQSGYMVLDDCANPNINPELDMEISATTYPWGRLPVYYVNSYKDLISVWGFSASEQVGDLIIKINQIVSKLMNYVISVMAPPLIVQQHCGITRQMIESSLAKAGRLILMPTTPNARIEFLQIPSLPGTFFQVLDLVLKFFDRIYQIEEADRGVNPTGVIAASAIVALQERNAVVMQTKTSSIDFIAEQRARWAIGLWQNFGIEEDSVNVGGNMTVFRPVQFAGRKFNYVVESGSTVPRTTMQQQELIMSLAKTGLLSRRYILERLNLPDWKAEAERGGESQLDMALQTLIDAGLPQEQAIALKQFLIQPQGGPGDVPKPAGTQNIPPAQRQGDA